MTGKLLSRSTTFGIRDTAFLGKAKNSWVLRVDNPHANVEFHHLNINPKTARVKGFKDPHMKLPAGSATAGEAVSKTVNVLGKAAIVLAVACDTIRSEKKYYFFVLDICWDLNFVILLSKIYNVIAENENDVILLCQLCHLFEIMKI